MGFSCQLGLRGAAGAGGVDRKYEYWKFKINSASGALYIQWGYIEAYSSKDGTGPSIFRPGFTIISNATGISNTVLSGVLSGTITESSYMTALESFVIQLTTPASIHSIKVHACAESGYVYCTGWTISGSDDGVSWTEIITHNPGSTTTTGAVLTSNIGDLSAAPSGVEYITTPARYWQLRGSGSSGYASHRYEILYVRELQCFESSNATGTNLSLGATTVTGYANATASITTGLNDDVTTVDVGSITTVGVKTFYLDLGAAYTLHSFKLFYQDNVYIPNKFDVLSSTDGSVWDVRGSLKTHSSGLISF